MVWGVSSCCSSPHMAYLTTCICPFTWGAINLAASNTHLQHVQAATRVLHVYVEC
jgi:hypothetical protein